MRNRLARQMVKSRVAWVIILTMFLNTFSIQAAYAAGEIAVPDKASALEEAEAAAVEKEEGETEGKPGLLDNNGTSAWLSDWLYSISDNSVILQRFLKKQDATELFIPASASVSGASYNRIKFKSNANKLFWHCEELTTADIRNVDTSEVTDMSEMFDECPKLKSISMDGISTNNVKNMSRMFGSCSELTNISWKGISTNNVTDMSFMFCYCKKLESLDMTGLNTENVIFMNSMFYKCENLKNLTISGLSTNKVKNMDSMFAGCVSLNNLDVSHFNTEKVEDMGSMFDGCSSLTSLDVSDFDTSSVKDMGRMFMDCKKLQSLDVSNFRTAKVFDMSYMFYDCQNLNNLDISGFDTSSVGKGVISTYNSMEFMFYGCCNLTSLDITHFNTANVRDMSSMFSGCVSINELDFSGISTNNVTDMGYMFKDCRSLKTLDLSNFDTSKVTKMDSMFSGCVSLNGLDVSGFKTGLVTSMIYMFNDCRSLKRLDLSSFYMGEVENANYFLTGMDSLDIIETPKNIKSGMTVYLPGHDEGVRYVEKYGPNDNHYFLPKEKSESFTYIKRIPATSVSVTPSENTISVGEQFTIMVTIDPVDYPQYAYWYIVNPGKSVVDLDDNGVVTGKAEGQATIIVRTSSSSNNIATCYVKVSGNAVEPTGITLDHASETISVNETLQISANVLPASATDKTVTWTSSNDGVASVDQSGKVRGKALGKATITARTSNNISANCVITVSNNTVKPVDITLNPKAKTISPNEMFHISANVIPANATDKSVTWLTNDKTVAVVDTNGNVTGKKTGKATITAKTSNGITATCAVTVSDNTVQPVSITLKPETKTISVNETFQISANVLPANATDKTVTWESNKTSVATVDKDGNVTGITEGDATITARTSNGKTKTCKVTVRGYKTIPVTGITVSPEILAIAVGDSSYITPTVYPLNATDKRVTWKSSSVSVAAVDKNGRVTGKAPGTAVITATAGGFSAECLVTVKKSAVRRPYSGLDPRLFYQAEKTADTYKAELVKGQKYSLGKGVWTTTDPKTVSVKKKTGVLTAKKAGTAKLTNTSGKTTAFNMTVYEPKLAVTSVTVLVGDIVNVSIRNTGSLPVSWVSGDIHKASVIMNEEDDNRAVITGVGKGKTRVYAYVNGKAFPVTVNVRDQAASRTLAANDSIRINAFNPVALKYISWDFKPSKVIKWSDTAGLEWRKDSKGNRTDHTGAVTISKGGKVTGNTAADSSPVIAMGRDSNGNSVVLEITVDAIPVKTDVYMNVGQTASLKHSYVKNSDRVRWIYDNKNINLSNADKVKTRIKALAAGEGTATCRYQDMEYYTYVHVEDPEIITEGGMKRTKPSAYNYTLSLKKGDSFDIGMSGVYQDVLWRSNKQGVAFVDEYGRISARGRGRATLSTRVNNRKLKINVTVE